MLAHVVFRFTGFPHDCTSKWTFLECVGNWKHNIAGDLKESLHVLIFDFNLFCCEAAVRSFLEAARWTPVGHHQLLEITQS